jgi:hypothetical protein
VRQFQSRRSLLIWKLYGQRFDGWSNADHPTESVPGIAATLPPGADRNAADLDYTGMPMPPPPALPLSEDERLTFVRWIDLGAPIDTGDEAFGWRLDDLKPTLALRLPRPATNSLAVTEIRIGLADANSGIDLASLSITADVPINGRPAGVELADLAVAVGDGIRAIALSTPIAQVTNRHVHASVRDNQGNSSHLFPGKAVLPSPIGRGAEGEGPPVRIKVPRASRLERPTRSSRSAWS